MIRREVAFLVYDGFQILDATGPIAAFEIAARVVPGAYRLRTIAPTRGFVVSSAGAALAAEPLEAGAECDTLIVAGGDGTREAAHDATTLAFVRSTAERVRRIASVCSGAYVLAAAGLLDGRRATTHWGRSSDFQRRFPRVRLEADKIFVQDGPIWTSAGITAGIDLALALIAEDLGEKAAQAVARQLVVYHRRSGGQSQFSALIEMEPAPGQRFSALLRWAGERLHERLSVEDLADQAAMSPRNFARAFRRSTGVTPAKAVERLRLDRARADLDAGVLAVERIAEVSGFGDAERMRRAFLRVYGRPPQAFRRAAREISSARPAAAGSA